MIPDLYVLKQLRQDTHDTFTLQLSPPNGDLPAAHLPGQFNMLYVFGVGEVPISISSFAGEHEWLTHTTREVGTVTKAMRRLKKGDTVGVRGPFGSHWPVEHAEGDDVLLVAGGIGLAPLRPALYHLMQHRNKYGKIVLLYGTRSPNDILYLRELKRWRSQFDLEVFVTVDRATGDWHGNVGVVPALIPKAPFDPTRVTALVCGPEIMMRFTVEELRRRGVASSRIQVSMERNMKCALGFCGHCQYGPNFVCKDGPVFNFERIESIFQKREI